MSLWSSLKKEDYSEHTPLSTIDDDEEEPPLPPYSDNPDTPTIRAPYSDTPQDHTNGNGAPVRRTNGRSSNGGGVPSSAHKAMPISNHDNNNYNDDDEEGFGEGDFYRSNSGGGSHRYSSTPSKHKRRNNINPATSTRYYRTGLICAYLQHWLTCCGTLGGGRTKRIFMCLFYTVLLVTIMVCASAIGYIIARDGSPFQPDEVAKTVVDADSNNSNNNAGESVFGASTPDNGGGKTFDKQMNAAKLPPPPLNLHEICSDWITESGRQKCQTECNKAECCSFPATNKNSCWEEQAEECATYRAACMALELHSDEDTQTTGGGSGSSSSSSSGVIGSKTILYAPPSNLPVLCSSTALSTPGGFDNCANVCRPSRCCFPDMFDCNLADDRYCEDYEDLCASVAESWRGSGHAVATTSSTTTSTGTSQTPAIANEVMKACNAANLNPPNECLEACKPGACCYVSTSYLPIEQLFDGYYGFMNSPLRTAKSCSSSVGFCQQYGSCEHLNHMKDVAGWNSDEVNYVVDVSTPCKAEHIAQFGALQCSNVCQPAHCCFSGEYACDDVQLGHLKCEDYKACQVLYPNKKSSTKELLELAERVDKVCSASSLKTIGGRAECQDVCSDHLCCFYQNGGCTNDADKNCLAYAGCESYYNMPTDVGQVDTNDNSSSSNNNNNNSEGSDTGSDVGIDEFEIALEEACSEENLKTINGIYKCHNKCQSHLCCFASGDRAQNDCANQRPVACNAYEPCKRLVSPIHADESVKTLEPADIEKIVFDACYFGADPLKVTEEMVQKCHGVCAQRFCCFTDYLLQSSCRATVGDDECELYSLCEQLVTDDGVEVSNAIELKENESDVAHLCTSKVNEDTDLYEACKELCIEKRECCFERPGYSCYEVEKEWCDEYKACERTNLKFTGGAASSGNSGVNSASSPSTPEMIEKDVYDACYFGDDELRVTQDLVTKCNNVCQHRYCCFDGYKLESSCRATVGEEECELFALCEQMISSDGGVVKNFIELDLQEFNDDDDAYKSSSQEMIEKDVYDACYFGDDESRVTQDLVTKCNNVCQHRYCCFDSYRLENSCRATVGEEECELFALCEQMITSDGGVVKNFIELDLQEFNDDGTSNSNSASAFGSIVQYPSGNTGTNVGNDADTFASQLENVCSENSLKTLEGLQACHSKCQTHLCCFTTDSQRAGQNCSGLIPAGCRAYEPCKRLVVPPGIEPAMSPTMSLTPEETEKRVYDACYFGDDPTRVTSELVTKCHGVCAPRLCCFSDFKLQSSCRATVGDDECQLYSLCDQLVTENGDATDDAVELEEKEFDVDQLCIDKVASDENLFYACSETCEKRSCCFESDPAYSCYDLEKDWCDEYAACAVVDYKFYRDVSSGENLPDSNTAGLIGSSSKEHDLYAALGSVCSVDSLKTLEGIEQCFNKCQPYLCCFPEDAAEMKWDCEEFRDEECSAYGDCEPLVALHQLWKPPPKAANKYAVKIAVNDACILGSLQPTEEWVSNCHQKCESRMCCLADQSIRSSCRDSLGADECNDYSSCKVLIGGDSRVAEGIEDVCSNVNDANSLAKCEAKCRTRQCCFEDVYKFSCYHLEKEWCDEYEICGVVGLTFSSSPDARPTPGAQISAPSLSQPSSQTTISVPTSSITPDVANNSGSGQYESMSGNTNNAQPVVDPSSQISQGDSDSELLILARACNADQLKNDATECKMLCKGSECCFTTHIENNCSRKPEMTAFCLDHMLCADLFKS